MAVPLVLHSLNNHRPTTTIHRLLQVTAFKLLAMVVSRVFLFIVIALLYLECCNTATIPRNFDPRLNDEVVMAPRKRPFCNAFTGCGRKRSQGAPGMPAQEIMRQRQYVDDDTLGSILDSEAAIDDLSRQILSEAKLWEAIQEASAEIARRKQKEAYNSQ